MHCCSVALAVHVGLEVGQAKAKPGAFDGQATLGIEAEEPDEGTLRGPTKKPRSIQFRVDADGKLNSLALFATSLMNRMSLPLSLLTPSS